MMRSLEKRSLPLISTSLEGMFLFPVRELEIGEGTLDFEDAADSLEGLPVSVWEVSS
jgi:hypothetical protein